MRVVVRAAAAAVVAALSVSGAAAAPSAPLFVPTIYAAAHPAGLMVTSGGWAYCLQLQALARHVNYTLLCGRYALDGYSGYGRRASRRLDWGNPAYLDEFARAIGDLHRRVGGPLVLIGVSYSGFGVATLAAHHPEIRPQRLIVIDSFLDLVARRHALQPKDPTALEIDAETGGSDPALAARSASADGLAQLVRQGTTLVVIWSTSPSEKVEFRGATCNTTANAATLSAVAQTLGRPVDGWVTQSRHGHDLWDRGRAIMAGRYPGRRVVFKPSGAIPAGSTC